MSRGVRQAPRKESARSGWFPFSLRLDDPRARCYTGHTDIEGVSAVEDCALQELLTENQRERLRAAIAQRTSVRAYIGPPDVAQLSALSFSAARLSVPGMRIELGEAQDSRLYRSVPFVDTIIGSGCYAAVIVSRDAPHGLLYAGACGEALVLEAAALGLGSCWVSGTFRRKAVELALSENERVAAVIALGEPAREKHKRTPRKKLTDICTQDPTGWPLWAYDAAEAVRVAPSAINRQPWRLSFAGRTLQLERAGLAGDLDMGIALMHLSLGVGAREYVLRLGEGRVVATLCSEDRT